MTDILHPSQLPQGSAQFIAYGAPERAADPQGGDPITVRPQVYVRYYDGILIKNLQEGGAEGDKGDLLTIQFDPQSVGLAKPIKAHMDLDDATVAILREKHAAGEPVAVAIETQRKRKNSESKAVISPLVPIHALRGADGPDGSGEHTRMMGPSGENTTNRLAMVNGRATKHLVSDPTEWAVLVSNKAGDLPPEGWRYYAPGEDWKEVGTIVPSGAPAQAQSGAGAPAPDLHAITAALVKVLSHDNYKDILRGVINDVLEQREGAADAGRPTGRPVSRKFYEGKQWDARTNDGRINLGNYAVADGGWCYRWAYNYLVGRYATDEVPTPEIDTSDAWGLSDLVLHMADRVQSESYAAIVDGGEGQAVAPDRMAASHREAKRWVEWVIEHGLPFPLHEDFEESESAEDGEEQPEDTYNAAVATWVDQVVQSAVEHYASTGRRVGHVYAEKAKAERERRQNAPAPEPKKDEGPSESVVNAMLGALAKTWDNFQSVTNLGVQANERGYGDLVVSMSTGEDGKPVISYPAKDGERAGALRDLIMHRWRELKVSAGDGPAPAQSEPQAETAPQAQPAPEASQSPQDDPNRGYSPEVAQAVYAIHGCRDMETLRSVYQDLREKNLLASTISVNPRPQGGFEFGANGQQGYAKRAISDVLNALRTQFTASDNEEQKGDEPSESAPEAEPVEQDAPAEQEPAQEKPEAEQETDDATAPMEQEQPVKQTAPESQQETDAAGGDSTDDLAHQIARRAMEVKTLDEMDALIAEAQEAGVYESTISMRTNPDAAPRKGPLRSWLKTLHKRMAPSQGA